MDEVNHFAEAAADAYPVQLFDVIHIQVGSDVGDEVIGDVKVVATKQDFGNDVAFGAEVFEVLFGTQVIKADGFGYFSAGCNGKAAFTVPVNDFETILLKFEAALKQLFFLIAFIL